MTTNENGTIQECCCGGCCGAHTECDCGEHIAVDPCLPVENTKTKVVQHADNVEQACRVCHADNVGTLYEGIQSLEAGDYVRIDGENRISCTLQAGDNISISEEGVISSESGLSQGRFTEITEDGKVNCTLQAGDGISIDEETGTVSCTMRTLQAGDLTEITEDGKVNSTLEAGRLMEFDANRLGSTLEAGDLMKIDEQTGKLDCTLQAGSNMSLEGDTMNCTLQAGKNISISETGNIDCALEAGNLMEITEDGKMNVTLTAGDGITIDEGTGEISNSLNLQAGRLTEITRQGDATVIASTLQGGHLTQINGNVVESTLQAGEHIDIAGNTISATYKAGNGITIEGDNIKAPNGYGLRYSNNKLSLYVLSGKGIKNKSEGSQNLDGFAYMPELDIEGGQGITIGNNGNTVTISTATPLDRDWLFEQADSVGLSDDIPSSSTYYYFQSLETDPYRSILDAARELPDNIHVDLTDNETVLTRVKKGGLYFEGIIDTQTGNSFDAQSIIGYDSSTPTCTFHYSQTEDDEDVNNHYGGFTILIHLNRFMPERLAKLVDRCIIASSPFWLQSGLHDNNYFLDYKKAAFAGMFKGRKALNIPEESSLLVYRDYNETRRLFDILDLYGLSKYQITASYSPTGSGTSTLNYISMFGKEFDLQGGLSFNTPFCPYLMGASYAQMKSVITYNFEAIVGAIPVEFRRYYVQTDSQPYRLAIRNCVDAFFGCFVDHKVISAHIENSDLIIKMGRTHLAQDTPTDDIRIPVPRMRIFIPKNEIIRKVTQMLADGEIDEYGNPTTQSGAQGTD